ncbi:AraC family transcriptional regulator [Paraglaciecola sp.]|uniref:AraC family transcriptional regulator n=1 Tax=Paraglaciecola sp. TaxID=1920173 RepID=UPI003EFAB388
MPKFIKISPSIESQQKLAMPITVVRRSIAANSVVSKHSHKWGQFVYANKGVLLVVTDSDSYVVPPEQGVWLLPEIEHEVTAITKVALTSFYFDNDLLERLPAQSCVLKINNFLKALILEANFITNDYIWSGADGLLLRLILEKLSLAPNVIFQLPFPKDPRLLTMLSMIQKEPSNRYDLRQWGEIIGASSRTISRLFKSETGLSYSIWRQRLNIQIAISQITKGESISNISSLLGYESPSAFTHMFKVNTGMTPSFYRSKE